MSNGCFPKQRSPSRRSFRHRRLASNKNIPHEVLGIIADNLSKAVGVGAVSQSLIPTGEQSGLLTLIATTESVSLCERMKS
jgi:hypothetical protein